MAGIGFELRRIMGKGSYLSEMTAYLYAALISSGPWLMSVICLGLLGLYRGAGFTLTDHETFRSTVIYTYAFSLIFVGVIQLVVTRYLADRFFLSDHKATMRAFFTASVLVLAAGTPLCFSLYMFFQMDMLYRVLATMLFLIVCLIWLAMIFLSAIKDYKQIVYAFAIGAAVSLVAAMGLFDYFGLHGYIFGYTAGQAVIFFWLLANMIKEFPMGRIWDRNMLGYFRKYWDLALIGFVYNLAIWIDKFVFWYAPDARVIVPYFRTHDFYEGPIFFSYLSIVPTLALFLIKTETTFYDHYRNYFAKIMDHRGLRSILHEKYMMAQMLRESMRETFIIQGAITLLCIVFATGIARVALLVPLQIPLLRVAFLGSFLQVLLSMTTIILFYFDRRKEVLLVSITYLFGNGVFSYITTMLGAQYYGYGYCYGCLLALMVGYFLLRKTLNDLEYITFAKQPMGG